MLEVPMLQRLEQINIAEIGYFSTEFVEIRQGNSAAENMVSLPPFPRGPEGRRTPFEVPGGRALNRPYRRYNLL